LPVLGYHGFESRPGEYEWVDADKPYVIPVEGFEAQLDRIVNDEFTSFSLSDLQQWLSAKASHERPVMITFDDGHISHYEHVAPHLKKKGLKAIFFISAGLVGHKGLMNWSQIKELVADGFEIGSHGLRHIPLTNLRHQDLWKELQRSKMILEDNLGIEIKAFSVPRGYYQFRVRDVALDLGYRFMFTSRFDLNVPAQDRLRLCRLAIQRKTSMEQFARLIHGHLGGTKVIEEAKETARRYLSPSIYDRLASLKRTLSHG